MTQNINGVQAIGTYSDTSTANITNTAAWTISDSTIATIGAADGTLVIQAAGKIWGGDVGVTATLAPGTPGTASLLVISSDSGSVAPLMPQQNNHWQALGLSPWGTWFGLQEPSGTNCAGSGSTPFTMTTFPGGGTGVSAQQTLPAWTRVGMSISGTSNTRIFAASGTGPNHVATSVGYLGYILLGPTQTTISIFGSTATTSTNRWFIGANGSSSGQLLVSTAIGAKNMVGPLTQNHMDRIHPFLVIYNKATGEMWGATDIAIAMSGGVTVASDDVKGFGPLSTGNAPSASIYWMAVATGSIVENLCSVSASADFLTRLGWNVSWKDCPTDSGSIKLPFLADHWKSLGLIPWTATWNLQEELGACDSFDRWVGNSVGGWQLAANAVDQYRYSIPNWKRSGLKMTLANDHKVSRTPPLVVGGALQFDTTGSFAMILYASASGSSAGASSKLLGIAGANATNAEGMTTFGGVTTVGGTQKAVVFCSGSSVTGSVAYTPGDRIRPWLFVFDKTNSRVKFYSDAEAITGSFSNLALVANNTGTIGFGGLLSTLRTTCSGVYVWGAFNTGSNAETLSDDGQASALLKTLGWNLSW